MYGVIGTFIPVLVGTQQHKESSNDAEIFHELPNDIKAVLLQDDIFLEKRNALTPLARDERICRVTIVKKEETRAKHLLRLVENISNGKKRSCCRPGCPHRRESAKKRFT